MGLNLHHETMPTVVIGVILEVTLSNGVIRLSPIDHSIIR